jgi:predicted transcriptional regulator
MNKRNNITPAEMEILQCVLDHAPVTVRDVADRMAQAKGLARTTVLTVMERLRQKGRLTRQESPSGYLYSPSAPKPDMQRGMVAEFVERSLGGSVSPFVAYLTERVELNADEMQALNGLLDKLAAQENPEKGEAR